MEEKKNIRSLKFINSKFIRNLLAILVSIFFLILSLPPLYWHFILWVALVPLFFAFKGNTYKRQALLGLIAGFFYYGYLFYWILIFGNLAFFSLVLYQALFWSLFAVGFKVFHNKGDFWGILLGIPLLWSSLEIIKSFGIFGLSWGLLGYGLLSFLPIVQAASLIGVFGLSFLIVMINSFLFILLERKFEKRRVLISFGVVLFLIMIAVTSYGYLQIAWYKNNQKSKKINIGLIQPNIPMDLKTSPPSKEILEERMIKLTEKAVQKNADLIIWPESSYPGLYFYDNDAYLEKVTDALEGTPLLFGSLFEAKNRTYNSAHYLNENGLVEERYDKLHPVPFGEYIPLRPVLQNIKALSVIKDDISAGEKPVILGSEEIKIGAVICFESSDIFLVRRIASLNPSLLVVITNDAWFGKTSEPEEHFRIGMMRAIENGLPFIQVANTGMTGVADPTGRAEIAGPIFTRFAKLIPVSLNGKLTLYRKTGHIQAIVMVTITLVYLIMLLIRAYIQNKK